MLLDVFLLCLSFLIIVSCTNEVVMNADGDSGKISFGPPTLKNEEESSLHMPADLRCDGCRIISYLVIISS